MAGQLASQLASSLLQQKLAEAHDRRDQLRKEQLEKRNRQNQLSLRGIDPNATPQQVAQIIAAQNEAKAAAKSGDAASASVTKEAGALADTGAGTVIRGPSGPTGTTTVVSPNEKLAFSNRLAQSLSGLTGPEAAPFINEVASGLETNRAKQRRDVLSEGNKGLALSIGPDGSVQLTEGGAAPISSGKNAASKNRELVLIDELDSTADIFKAVGDTLKDPERGKAGGIVGNILGKISKGTARLGELDSVIGTNFISLAQGAAEAIDNDESGEIPEEFKSAATDFLTDVVSLDTERILLSYGLARALRGSGRPAIREIEAFQKLLNFRGLESRREIVARVGRIETRLRRKAKGRRRAFEASFGTKAPPPLGNEGQKRPKATGPKSSTSRRLEAQLTEADRILDELRRGQ